MIFDISTRKLDFKVRQYEKVRIRKMCFAYVDNWIEENGRPMFRDNIYVLYYRRSVNPMDEDGVATSAKYWLDALTEKGIIKDDKPLSRGGHIQFIPISHQGKPQTRIEIWDMSTPVRIERMIKEGKVYRIRIETINPEK